MTTHPQTHEADIAGIASYSTIEPHIGRLRQGADIISPLEAYAAEKDIHVAWIHGLGAITKATLCFYDQARQQYVDHVFEGEYEVVSCTGNLSYKDGKPFAHLHMVISDQDGKAYGGHLWPGSASVFAFEFTINAYTGLSFPASAQLVREPDAATGLSLWRCPL